MGENPPELCPYGSRLIFTIPSRERDLHTSVREGFQENAVAVLYPELEASRRETSQAGGVAYDDDFSIVHHFDSWRGGRSRAGRGGLVRMAHNAGAQSSALAARRALR